MENKYCKCLTEDINSTINPKKVREKRNKKKKLNNEIKKNTTRINKT